MRYFFLYQRLVAHEEILIPYVGLGESSILTGLQPLDDKTFTWDGSSQAQNLEWAPKQPAEGGCASFTSEGLTSTSCDTVSNFMCEAKSPETTLASPVNQV
jgi:hypothetical protein